MPAVTIASTLQFSDAHCSIIELARAVEWSAYLSEPQFPLLQHESLRIIHHKSCEALDETLQREAALLLVNADS